MLLPDTRKPFFDRRLRWWERASRFSIKEPCYYIFEGELYKAQLIDLSETGVLLSLQENKLTQGNFIKMDFKLLNEDYEINGEVVRKLNGKESENHLFGIQFKFDNIFQRYKMKFLHYSIKKSQKYPIYRK
jgi:c-di-GMP-binding flagellar brake protein YcgR